MSLEQAILDRLEKRNGQIAQLQSTVHALERAADSQREHAMIERGLLLDENKKLAAQIEASQWNREHLEKEIIALRTKLDVADPEVLTRSERLIKSLNDEITKRDHELRAHEKELAEQREEIRKLRAEVPLESTREGLKNAVAKLQEVTADRDRVLNELAAIVAEANKSGRCGGDPVALLKQGQVDRDTAESLDRQLGAALALSNERAQEIRKLIDGHAEDMKAQAELLSKYESLLIKITDLGSYAMTLGRKEGEPLEMFMERQALRLAALEPQARKIGYVAKGEHEEAVTAARENGIHKGESLSGFIWRQCEGLRKSQAENAPLNKLFVVLCKQRGNLNEEIIYRAVDEASDAINKLTA